jgi:hypothetical protein
MPVKFWSDSDPQFTSDQPRHFIHSYSHSKVSVKSMKKLIRGSWTAGCFNIDELSKGFLLYRNAPISGGALPAQLVFNRPVRDCLPAHRRSFAPQ